jgi:hypothetical protein
MKTRAVQSILIVSVWVFSIGCGGTMSVLQPTISKNDSLSGSTLVYRHTARDWRGRKSISHKQIPAGTLWESAATGQRNGENLFGMLVTMQDSARIREMKRASNNRGSMIIERGLKLVLDGKTVEMDVTCNYQLQESKPLRYIFDVIPPSEGQVLTHLQQANLSFRKYHIVYQWGYHKIGNETHWVPIEIFSNVIVVQASGVEREAWERWELQEIRNGS